MNWNRVIHSIGMSLQTSGQKRATYLRKHKIFRNVGNHCMVMFRKIPLYPKLISLGNNVWIATNVLLVTHDMIHQVLNYSDKEHHLKENVGCIDIKDNVFIGSGSVILPDTTIGPNTIIGAGTVVNRDLGEGVYAGVPARYICSLEEFREKRMRTAGPVIEKDKGDLTEKTIEELWKAFKEKQEAGSNE